MAGRRLMPAIQHIGRPRCKVSILRSGVQGSLVNMVLKYKKITRWWCESQSQLPSVEYLNPGRQSGVAVSQDLTTAPS